MSVVCAHRVASGLRGLIGVATVVVLAATGLLVVPGPAPVAAAPGDGTVAVRVVQDFNANGNWDDPLVEPGLAGVLVDFADASGAVRTVPTDGAGVATLTALPGSYRVVVHNPDPARFRPAFASEKSGTADTPDDTRLSTTEEFVTVAADQTLQVTTAFWDPADYCQANPLIADACQQPIYAPNGTLAANATAPTLYTAPYRGTGHNIDIGQISVHGDTGTVYGVGWRKQDRRLFAGAFAKRGAAYGPGGPGAIYVTSVAADGTPGPTSVWGVVPDAGETPHSFDVSSARADWDFAGTVGKEALGDLDVSEDGRRLHVLNLRTRQLFVYDASSASMGAPLQVVDLPDPGCAAAADWRPGALAERHGTLYVGGVCSAETSRNRADLRTIVVTLDASSYAATGTVLDQPMMVRRPRNYTCGGALNGFTQWNPWGTELGCMPSNGPLAFATPWLGDIVVENNGDLVLGFRDRTADQHGYNTPYFKPGNAGSTPDGVVYLVASGDLTRACPGGDGRFVLDYNGACGLSAVPETTIVGEFYKGDGSTGHAESAFGGIGLSRAERGVVSSWMDPDGHPHANGYGRVDRFDGRPLAYSGNGRTAASTPVWTGNGGNHVTAGGGFGKGQGMADLEVLCDLAPLQIGNRVWMDPDRDGIQDPDEEPIPGVTVNLYDATGGLVATTVTNSRGEYYFDSLRDGLRPETSYVIRLDDAANYDPGAPLDADVVRLTRPDRGTGADQDRLDSDGRTVDGYPQHAIVTGSSGSVDHTYDFGFSPPPPPSVSVGDLVWLDTDEDGLQDGGEPGIEGVVLVLTGPDGRPVTDVNGDPVGPVATDADGHYSFDDLPVLPPGQHYTVSIDRDADGTKAALDGLRPTPPGTGGRDEDSSTWSAESADLTQDGARDPTLDFGFHPVRVPPQEPATPRVETTTSHARAGVGTELYDVVRVEGLRPGGSSVGTATLYGPFTSPAAVACTPATAVGSVTFAPVNGVQRTPTVRVEAPGYYTWQVTLSADEHNRAASHPCGLASETSLITRAVNPVRVIDTGFAGRSGTPAHGRGVLPTRLRLPAVGIDAAVVPAGLKGRRASVPARPSITGWLDTSARVDDVIGTAVIVGHVSDRHDRPGALVDLGRARKGQRVTLRDSAGTVRAYQVRRLRTFDRARPLPARLFRMTGAPRVQLVTCTDRVVDRHGRFHYRRNLVVTLVPVGGQ